MLPKLLRPASNGEYLPPPPSEVVVEAGRRTLAHADRVARGLGMDRRAFLRSSAGTAATLLALNACTGESGGGDAGSFDVPEEAGTDPTAAEETLGSSSSTTSTTEPFDQEVVVDVQTHFLDPDTVGFGRGFPQSGCGDDASLCFTIDRWADLVLESSDTSVAVLSALPIVADEHPMSIEKMEEARRLGEAICGNGRVLLQGEAFPQVGDLAETLDRMAQLNDQHRIVAWKTYTHVAGGYSLVDDERGEAFLARVEELAATAGGPRVVCVHKGFGADPADLGPAAAAHPDLVFCAYHSGFEASVTEGPYRDDGDGVDRFVRSLRDAGVGPGSNVYAELGSTWRYVLAAPDQAAHVLGKLLAAVGPERILWGTDSVWYGSPQDQIEAFRAFEISAEAQERFGYPALTPEVKRRIFGANAAGLHGLDLAAVAQPCSAVAREDALARLEPVGLAGAPLLAGLSRREILSVWRREHPWFRF